MIEGHDRRLARLRDSLVAAQTEQGDIEGELAKAEADVAQVRQRATRDQQRLDTGSVSSPRELEQLQHEIETLGRRQSALEDLELEVMERLEDVTGRRSALEAERAGVEEERAAAVATRDVALAEVAGEEALHLTMRTTLAGQIAPELIALYEKIREKQGGMGAAALVHRRCSGCRMEMNVTERSRLTAAPPEEVLRCEECSRILVRTAESGL